MISLRTPVIPIICSLRMGSNLRIGFSATKWDNDYTAYKVKDYEDGQRLDRYLKATKIGWISAQKYLREKTVVVKTKEGQIMNSNDYRLQTDDLILLKKDKMLESLFFEVGLSPNIRMDVEEINEVVKSMVIFDNPNIVILNKQGGYSVQGGDEIKKNLYSLLARHYQRQVIHIAHRLDRPTTGVLMLTKNGRSAKLLQTAIQKRVNFQKYYLALTEGRKVPQKNCYVRCNIEWSHRQRSEISLKNTNTDANKDSITYSHLLRQKQLDDITFQNLFGLKLITGRKHQLRCHLTEYLLNPILNDTNYGGRLLKHEGKQCEEMALHAFAAVVSDREICQEIFNLDPNTSTVAVDNELGRISVEDGVVTVLAKMPGIWKKPLGYNDMENVIRKMIKGQAKLDERDRMRKNVSMIE